MDVRLLLRLRKNQRGISHLTPPLHLNAPLQLDATEAQAFARVCCGLLALEDRAALEALLTGADFQTLIPFGAAVVGVGLVQPQGVSRFEFLPIHFPETHLHALRHPEQGLASPLIRRWVARREPVLFDAAAPEADIPADWLASFRAHDLQNCLAHGGHDFSSNVSSYFAFCRLPALSSRTPGRSENDLAPTGGGLGAFSEPRAPLNPRLADLLRLLTPHLHQALIRLVAHALRSNALDVHLTPREREMLSWLYLGKTNWEIGSLLGITEKTVKNRMSTVFDKLGVHNRTQLLVKISDMGLLATRPDEV